MYGEKGGEEGGEEEGEEEGEEGRGEGEVFLRTIVIGMAYLGEPANAGRIFFLILLMVAIIGLKLTAQ